MFARESLHLCSNDPRGCVAPMTRLVAWCTHATVMPEPGLGKSFTIMKTDRNVPLFSSRAAQYRIFPQFI